MITIEKSELARAIWAEIKIAKKILLHLHVNTDGDSVGSTLALKRALISMGKEVDVIAGDNKQIPGYLSFLPGTSDIIIKKFSEIDFNNYDIFIALDTSSSTQLSREEGLDLPKNKIVVIDHHKGNSAYGKINLVDSDYVATCELLVDFLKVNDISIDEDMAVCLYVGICTDSGNFLYPPTNGLTLSKAAELAQISPKTIQAANKIASNTSLSEFMATNICMQSVKFYFENSVAVACITENDLKRGDCFSEDFSPTGVASTLSKVEGVKTGIGLYEKEGVTRISFRSKDPKVFNVRQVAEKFPIGGGHDAAAGATFNGSVEEAKEFLLTKIKEALGV